MSNSRMGDFDPKDFELFIKNYHKYYDKNGKPKYDVDRYFIHHGKLYYKDPEAENERLKNLLTNDDGSPKRCLKADNKLMLGFLLCIPCACVAGWFGAIASIALGIYGYYREWSKVID